MKVGAVPWVGAVLYKPLMDDVLHEDVAAGGSSPIAAWRRCAAALVGLALAIACAVAPAGAATPAACQDGVLPGGALSRICVPAAGWNGDLVVWAHGYIAFNEPIDFYHLTFADGTSLPDLVQRLGFAFATTSFRENGLAVLAAIDDVRELIDAVPAVAGRAPGRTYMTGASEGGLVTVLAIERHPDLFAGGLAACGPIGSFARQVDYIGDVRVLFDYFFPGVLPGSPTVIPTALIDDWDAVYVPAIASALAANPAAARDLIRTSGAAVDAADPTTIEATVVDVLWYNVFGTNDAVARLGGNPYTNRGRFYLGSSNDLRLNLRVRRVSADPVARAGLVAYETSGRLSRPVVALHTGRDPVIPFWHEQRYAAKVEGTGRFVGIPVDRYGHCQFTVGEMLSAFVRLLRSAR